MKNEIPAHRIKQVDGMGKVVHIMDLPDYWDGYGDGFGIGYRRVESEFDLSRSDNAVYREGFLSGIHDGTGARWRKESQISSDQALSNPARVHLRGARRSCESKEQL